MPSRTIQPAKYQAVRKNYTWDFLSDLLSGESIVSAVVTLSVYSGNDPSPVSMLNSEASFAGSIVSQTILGGVVGVIYEAVCAATTNFGSVLVQVSFIAVIATSP